MLEKGTVVFGNWMVESEIGSGAFGTVYKIKREDFGGEYFAAMKVIRIPQDKDDKSRLYSEGMNDTEISLYYKQIAKDFVKEIKMLSSLDGVTNIVDYKDHVIEPNEDLGYTIYIKMQLLTPVSKLLVGEGNKAKFLNSEDIIRLGKDMCSALEVCEKKRIIHRDVKIDNIFISDEGDYKLGDFGIARQLEATQGEMSKKGTLMYMAPEVFKGEKYDRTADIYSLGVVLYRLLNKNRAPFYPDYPNPIKLTDKESANAKRLKGDEFPDIAGISAELNAVLKKACAFNPRDRYQSANDFRVALEGVTIEPVISIVSASVDENVVDDEKTESIFDSTLVATTPVIENITDDATEETIGVFGTLHVEEPVFSDSFYENETVILESGDDDKTESVFPPATAPATTFPIDGGTVPAEKETKKSRIIKLVTRLVLGLGVAALILFGKNYDNNYVMNEEENNTTTATTKTAQTTNNKGTTAGNVPTNSYYNDGYYNDNYHNDNYYSDNYYNDGYYDDNYYNDDNYYDDDDYYYDDYDDYYDYDEYS